MPHDRVFYCDKEKKFAYQAAVEFTDEKGNENIKEIKQPITDSTVKRVLNLYEKLPQADELEDKKFGGGLIQKILQMYYKQNDKNVFLPTYCYKILQHIQNNIPNHHLVMADFDLLRTSESALEGINAPIVSRKGK